jgi:hypothetical protein
MKPKCEICKKAPATTNLLFTGRNGFRRYDVCKPCKDAAIAAYKSMEAARKNGKGRMT